MKRLTTFLILAVLLAAVLALGIFVGGSDLSVEEIVAALLNPYGGGMAHSIIWQLRIPRVLMALLVGSSLAGCGVVFQAVLRNPLAEPYTLGVSAGGALGATIAIITGLSGLSLVSLCFAGCLLSIALVLAMSTFRNFSTSTIILSGVVLSFLFSSIVMFIFSVASSREVHASVLWLMGSLNGTGALSLPALLAALLPLLVCLLALSRDMNLISLGDEKAHLLGLAPGSLKILLLGLASLVTGLCVAMAGIIGFVGLIIPHVMRRAAGADHQVLMPAAMLAGGMFLVLSDVLAQVVIRPYELPVGVITGIAGGIFFLAYLFKAPPPEVF